MRSRCTRSIMTTSASLRPRAHVVKNLRAPSFRAGGHQSRRADETHLRAEHGQQRHVRARDAAECSDVAADGDGEALRCRRGAQRMVKASSSACVGCSCLPSPALMTAQSTLRESNSAAPDEPWRTTSKIRAHRVQCRGGVDQRFAFGDA